MVLRDTEYYCPSCGARNMTRVNLTSGKRQIYVEDCEMCCRPIVLKIDIEEDTDEIVLQAEPES